MTDSIRRSLASLDELEAWLADSGVMEIADESRRLDHDEKVVQAATVVIPAVSLGDVRFADLPRVLWREARVGTPLGGMLAVVGFIPVAVFFATDLAWVVSLTLLSICTWATFAGAMLPIVADRVGIDPAVVSAPFITTLVDATGLILYFLIARAVLGI